MAKIRAVLLDLSGTLHVETKAIPGAVQAITRLQESNVPIRVLTNTSTVSAFALQQQLSAMGFSFQSDQIFTSVLAVKAYLKKKNLRPWCLLEDTSDFEGLCLDPPYNCVVLGLAPSKCNYENLDKGFQILQQGGELIAMHRSTFVKKESGSKSLGPGAFVAALEAAVPGCQATILGKPSKGFFKNVLWDDIDPSEICLVGDDLVGDIQGAQEVGVGTTLLVKTGKYMDGDKLTVEPTKVLPSIVEAVDYILENLLAGSKLRA